VNHTMSLYDQVAAIPGGERLKTCLQCGTCGGSCPSGPDMDHTPRALFAMILAGQREPVLRSNTFWYCVSCYYCTVRCPQQIPITELMYRLKRIAAANGERYTSDATAFSRTFVAMVERFGRGYEVGLAAVYYLTRRPLALFDMLPFTVGMLKRRRLAIVPARVKDMAGLGAILGKAKEIARARDRETGVIA
jgi:heterodisulfide reductase subunit C